MVRFKGTVIKWRAQRHGHPHTPTCAQGTRTAAQLPFSKSRRVHIVGTLEPAATSVPARRENNNDNDGQTIRPLETAGPSVLLSTTDYDEDVYFLRDKD
mgnify:CR=1 FL=1